MHQTFIDFWDEGAVIASVGIFHRHPSFTNDDIGGHDDSQHWNFRRN